MLPTTFKTRHLDLQPQHPESIKRIFDEHWPAYKAWYTAKTPQAGEPQAVREAQSQLAHTLPEMLPVYESLCEISDDCPIAAHFLSGYQPPAYLVNCSQAVLTQGDTPVLIRNYDLSPDLSENLISHTHWLGQTVIGTNECLWGLDDGMNQAGLAVSLTFGGSKTVGTGFGIPFILRYVLQTCDTVKQAITTLQRIPSHMAYNVTLLDKQGDFATVMLVPDQTAIVTRERCITNHQQQISWPEQAAFSKTLERKQHIEHLLNRPELDEITLRQAFLSKPLHSTNYAQQFGTLFTAVYHPEQGSLSYHWPHEKPLQQSLRQFSEQDRIIPLGAVSSLKPSAPPATFNTTADSEALDSAALGIPAKLREQLLATLAYLPLSTAAQTRQLNQLQRLLKTDQSLSWAAYGEHLAGLWRLENDSQMPLKRGRSFPA